MEIKKSKLISVTAPQASRNPGTNYSFLKFENGDKGAIFFKTPTFKYKEGDIMEYIIEEKDGNKKVRMAAEQRRNGFVPRQTNNRLEALKMAIEAYTAGRIDEKRIKPMAKFLENILEEK